MTVHAEVREFEDFVVSTQEVSFWSRTASFQFNFFVTITTLYSFSAWIQSYREGSWDNSDVKGAKKLEWTETDYKFQFLPQWLRGGPSAT